MVPPAPATVECSAGPRLLLHRPHRIIFAVDGFAGAPPRRRFVEVGRSLRSVRRVAIIGNGSSVSASAQFKMASLTGSMRTALHAIDGGVLLGLLDQAGALLWPDPSVHKPQTNFEHLLGPLDRLTLLLRGPLLGIIGTIAQQPAALHAASAAVDAIYVRGVGSVLQVLDGIHVSHAPVQSFVNWLIAGLAAGDTASVYTVNYDSMIDQWLFEADGDATRPAIRVDDEFAELPGTLVQLTLPGPAPQELRLIPLRPPHLDRPAGRNVHLYHLHGALHWVDYQGAIYKAKDMAELRQRGVFGRWAAGQPLPIRPQVLLTDQKTRAVALEPFAQNYASLRDDLPLADRVLIAGYAFGDVPLNEVLADGWAQHKPTSRWLVADHAILFHGTKEQRALRALDHLLGSPRPNFSWAGIPGVVAANGTFWS